MDYGLSPPQVLWSPQSGTSGGRTRPINYGHLPPLAPLPPLSENGEEMAHNETAPTASDTNKSKRRNRRRYRPYGDRVSLYIHNINTHLHMQESRLGLSTTCTLLHKWTTLMSFANQPSSFGHNKLFHNAYLTLTSVSFLVQYCLCVLGFLSFYIL